MNTESKTTNWTIIIPVKPGGKIRALESLQKIDYPHDKVEIIVAEGYSPSLQRNRAAALASGKFLYFFDDDTVVSPDILKRAESHYENTEVAVVGGPSLTPGSDPLLQQSFGATLASFIGGGSVRNRYKKSGSVRSTKENELILCNLSFRSDVFLDCGGLTEHLYPNEENEMMDRILQKGWKLIHDPDLAVTRGQRRKYRAFVRQFFTYGRGRGEQTVFSKRINPASLIPSLFLLYLAMLPLLSNPVYTLPLLCYAGAVFVTALSEAFQRKLPALIPLLLLTIPTLHFAYGAGMFLGLARPRYNRDCNAAPEVTLRRVEI